ncbi:MAG: TldD/PmbA family protein [Rhodospirillaceae bacterium]|jgi:PmbA protein|nr:TldD/PmbA family protein [Rhodospirillaceae bacterium]
MICKEAFNVLTDLVTKAKIAGADAADAFLINKMSLSVMFRLGRLEEIKRSESMDISLRVFIGNRQAIVSSSDWSCKALDELIDRVVRMARIVPKDPFCGLADPSQLVINTISLDICDPIDPTSDVLIDWTRRAEDSARSVLGVTNSDGAEAGYARKMIVLIGSNGMKCTYNVSKISGSVSVLAGNIFDGMERDYDFSSAVYFSDLKLPEDIGYSAGHRAVNRLRSHKVCTTQVPIVFDSRVSNELLGHLSNSINGYAIARGASFLKNSLNKQIFPSDVTIIDDPHRQRGLHSKPCDDEGVINSCRNIVENGVLTTWILDLCSSRQLGMETTGHASRGISSFLSPSATNFYMKPGIVTPTEIISNIVDGFYVTELFGIGVNNVTGDYSRGATGFWISKGEITYPVSEVTIAGNLKEMFLHLTPANDLFHYYGFDAPTVLIDGMTVAGI